MKINDRYEIRVVVLEIRDGIGVHNSIGDIYDNSVVNYTIKEEQTNAWN